MNRVSELEAKITELTNKINSEYPELTKYILEIPMNLDEEGKVNLKSLNDYYKSLEDILSKYANTHESK